MKVFILIDRLGMKKFFLQGKGFKFLKLIEDINSCIIVLRERNENEVLLILDEEEKREF